MTASEWSRWHCILWWHCHVWSMPVDTQTDTEATTRQPSTFPWPCRLVHFHPQVKLACVGCRSGSEFSNCSWPHSLELDILTTRCCEATYRSFQAFGLQCCKVQQMCIFVRQLSPSWGHCHRPAGRGPFKGKWQKVERLAGYRRWRPPVEGLGHKLLMVLLASAWPCFINLRSIMSSHLATQLTTTVLFTWQKGIL